jgi:hypothetical protein
MNTWDEKNYTKPKSNCLNNNEQEPSDTTKITKSDSMQPEWIDIGGVKKWIRNCPECEVEILCPTKRQATKYTKKGRRCKSCSYKHRIISVRTEKPNTILTKEELTRNCPNCNCEIVYTNKGNRNMAEKHGKLCKPCISKSYEKYERPNKLERNCPSCGQLVKYKASNPRVAFHNYRRACVENRVCRKCKTSGKNNPMYGTSRAGKDNPNYNKRWSKEQRTHMRKISVQKYIERGYTFNNYNPSACKYFDILSEERGWELKHAENGGEVIINGYFLDAYDEKRNIVVEYDEPHHYVKGNLKKKDIDRMNSIIQHTNCKFYRYNERTKEFYECKSNFNSTTVI